MQQFYSFYGDQINIDERIDIFINKKIDNISRNYIKKLIENSDIKVNSKKVKVSYKLKENDTVEINIPEPEKLDVKEENIPIEIIYEDDSLLIVNKPKGMVVHPSPGNYNGTLVNALLYHCKENLSNINGVIRPGIVHRIDKDTTGVLVVAKTNYAHQFLSTLLKEHDIKREYRAITEGVIKENKGIIDAPIGRHPVDRKKMAVNIKNGKNAITHFEVIERFKKHTYIKCSLETGRTHQIRVHMSYIGYPLLGDKVYGFKKQKYNTSGQVLHAGKLGFIHPKTNEYIEFNSSLPEYFDKLLSIL